MMASVENREGRGTRVLVVEDDFLIALSAEDALESAGYEVVGIAADFEQALNLADAERPDLALVDIRLGSGRDGVEAAIEMRRRFGIPSLFASASDDARNRERAEPAGPLGWLSKPYSMQALLAAVERATAGLAART